VTIRNPKAFLDSIWDWAPLKGCLPRGIEPTDIDGWIEVGGYFLVLEGKAPGVPIPTGQAAAFARMVRWNKIVPQLFTIIVIWGDAPTGRIDHLQFWPNLPVIPGDWDTLREYIYAWGCCAEERAAIQQESPGEVTLITADAKAFARR